MMLVVISIAINLLYFGCTAVPTETVMMKDIEGVKMSATELGIRLNEFGKFFAGTVEEAADDIIQNTNNVEVKKNALLWKSNAIPAALKSLTILDPVASGIDLFALCYQMKYFFEVGYGKVLFGDQQHIAINASDLLVKEAEIVADDFRDKKYRDTGDRVLATWVIQNPIKKLNFNRRSTFEVTAKTLGSEEYDLGSTVGSMAVGIHDIRRQITVYTEFLPKQIKWQAQYELFNLMGDSTIEKSLNNIDRVVLSTERISKMIEESPELFREIQLSTFVELDKQRLQTLELISQERIAILEAITAERIAIMEQIHDERTESLDRIEEITSKTVNQSSLFASDVIDKIFWRVLIILAVVFIGGIIVVRLMKK
jgi:hypothetical protein